jgi:hypothetical protein
MNDRTALDGRYQLIKISDECWTLICDCPEDNVVCDICRGKGDDRGVG